MPSVSRRRFSNDFNFSSDAAMKDASALLNFDDVQSYQVVDVVDHDQMLFGDMDDVPSAVPFPPWNSMGSPNDMDNDVKPVFGGQSMHYEYGPAQGSPTDSYYDSSNGGGFYTPEDSMNSPSYDSSLYLANWVNDPEPSSSSSPIPIPSPVADIQMSQFVPYVDQTHFPHEGTFSPSEFAALHPLPSSFSPSSSFDDAQLHHRGTESVEPAAVAPRDASLGVPQWTSLWDGAASPSTTSAIPVPKLSSPQPRRRSPLLESTLRLRPNPSRRGSVSAGLGGFLSTSAPAFSPLHGAGARPYSRRTESSMAVSDDRDATIRRRRKISAPEEIPISSKHSESVPLKSVLKPPKLAPSAWQLYFTDWIQRQQASNTRKLNVAQAAKEAGQEYANLTPEEKEPYKQKSQAMKEARERELDSYMRTLSPDDIKRENAFRAAQRKAGKSRKSNIKDPNAPKKPLSAYFMFLQRIRADPRMVHEVFGEETETTKQSVLAAAKWRAMTDDERKPFLAQAEQEKMEYEAARKLYEEGPSSFNTSFNFSILPGQGSPGFSPLSLKVESESESEVEAQDRHQRL